jgi:hypothetical protein
MNQMRKISRSDFVISVGGAGSNFTRGFEVTDVWPGDSAQGSSVISVPSGAGQATFRAAASSECCPFATPPFLARLRHWSVTAFVTGKARKKPGKMQIVTLSRLRTPKRSKGRLIFARPAIALAKEGPELGRKLCLPSPSLAKTGRNVLPFAI